jgi:hypothetical protein
MFATPQSLRNKSGSLAMFAAMRLASSFVSSFAADRPLRFAKIRVPRLTQIPKQELSAPHHADYRGRIFFDHDALLVTEINSRSPAGLRPEVANLIHVEIEGHLLSFAH